MLTKATQNIAEKKFKQIKDWLQQAPFEGFTGKDLFIMQFIKKGWGQDIAALSNMAEALSNIADRAPERRDEIRPLLEEVIRRARHPSVSPYRKDPAVVSNLNHYGYYLEHLNIVLGCYHRLFDDKYLQLNERISEYLRSETLAQSNTHARLIPHVRMRWSADQAAILHSLWLFDQNTGAQLADEPVQRWKNFMETQMRHAGTGLYGTEVMNVKSYSKEPRGCACAYLTHYTAKFAPEIAQEQWQLMKKHLFVKKVGITGFREYRDGYQGRWTPDSGPIVAGVGVAATGLALKTAGTLGDAETFDALFGGISRSIGVLETLNHLPGVKKIASIGTDLLSSSIYLAALTAPPPQESVNTSQQTRGEYHAAAA
jgi:hypothetical protein